MFRFLGETWPIARKVQYWSGGEIRSAEYGNGSDELVDYGSARIFAHFFGGGGSSLILMQRIASSFRVVEFGPSFAGSAIGSELESQPMTTLVDARFGKKGCDSVVYPIGVVVLVCAAIFVFYFAVLSAMEGAPRYSVTTWFLIMFFGVLWVTLGGIRGGFQCFKVIQRAELEDSWLMVKTFRHSKTVLHVDNISSIQSFSAKPAMSLLTHDLLNYLVTFQDGTRYVISGCVECAEDFLKKLHMINPEISLSLAEKGFRSHWNLEPQ